MKNMLPGWEIIEKIGSGGFSTVYKIKKIDSAGDGEFYAALKIMTIPSSPEEYDNYIQEGYDEETITTIFTNQVKKLEEEFRLMARFKGNSNIVSYEDHMVVPHQNGKGWDILIRMELLDPLTKYCNKTPLSVVETVKLGVDICRALELCQKANITHRDIKPQNIFVNEFGDYKLGDFGIARTMDHATHATRTGTYTYIAPEVFHGYAYDSTVDIYSLGLVLYWLLNERRLPFLPLPPAAPSANQINEAASRRIAGEQIPPPVNGSDELKRIVLKACAFKPENRYSSATEMKEDLEDILLSARGNNKKSKAHVERDYEIDSEKTWVLEQKPRRGQPENKYSVPQNDTPASNRDSGNNSNLFSDPKGLFRGDQSRNTNQENKDSAERPSNGPEYKPQYNTKYASGSTKSNPKKVLGIILFLEIFGVVAVIAAIVGVVMFAFRGCEKDDDSTYNGDSYEYSESNYSENNYGESNYSENASGGTTGTPSAE